MDCAWLPAKSSHILNMTVLESSCPICGGKLRFFERYPPTVFRSHILSEYTSSSFRTTASQPVYTSIVAQARLWTKVPSFAICYIRNGVVQQDSAPPLSPSQRSSLFMAYLKPGFQRDIFSSALCFSSLGKVDFTSSINLSSLMLKIH